MARSWNASRYSGHGHWYGTLKSHVEAVLDRGESILLEIDVNGMEQVRTKYADALTIFVRPDSLEELERRLRDRKTENEESIRKRLDVARQEWQFKDRYEHDVVNDEIDRAAEEIMSILRRDS